MLAGSILLLIQRRFTMRRDAALLPHPLRWFALQFAWLPMARLCTSSGCCSATNMAEARTNTPNRIVVGVDLLETGDNALREALRIAQYMRIPARPI